MLGTALTVAVIAATPVGGDIKGPRVGAHVVAGQSVALWGAVGEGTKVLAAGDRDVLAALALGCPPPDADMWLADEATPELLAEATAQLRPDVTIVFRRGATTKVTGGRKATRYAAWTGIPLVRAPGASTVTVTLAARPGPRKASRLAYGIDRLAGTRFAKGAQEERRMIIAHGDDPRRFGKT